jgi:hypothetical protein
VSVSLFLLALRLCGEEELMNHIVRRAGWTSLALCFAMPVAADACHPHIEKSQVVSLDVAAIERNADSGTPIELKFGATQWSIVLQPAPVWGKEGLSVLEVRDRMTFEGL